MEGNIYDLELMIVTHDPDRPRPANQPPPHTSTRLEGLTTPQVAYARNRLAVTIGEIEAHLRSQGQPP